MRLVLIDNYSGYIFGDTATLAGFNDCEDCRDVETMCLRAARLLDESIGGREGRYDYQSSNPRIDSTGYDCYEVSGEGADVVGDINDGQDQAVIDDVINCGKYVGSVAFTRVEE